MRKHIGFFVDYASGVATKDKAKQDKSVSDLVGYMQDFGAFLASANPSLPKATVADLVKTHVLTLKEVVDAQGMGDQKKEQGTEKPSGCHVRRLEGCLFPVPGSPFPIP